MNHLPQLKQQDAKVLAQGYSRWFRGVEIFSIVSFWLLTAGIVYRLSAYAHAFPWLLTAAFLVGFIAADFVSGFVHWLADTWGDTDMPVIGKALLRPFREHHVDPLAMTRHDYIETNGANCGISVPVAAMAISLPLRPDSEWLPFFIYVMASTGSMIFWVMMTNQFHKWSHTPEEKLPFLAKWAQRMHLILPPAHHDVHHTAPFSTYYCITNGWLNWPLHKLGFFRVLERMVTSISGAIPRKDDIGAAAALAVAHAEGITGEQGHTNALNASRP